MAQMVRSTCGLTEGLGSGPSTQWAAHNHLKLQARVVQCPLVAFTVPA